MRTGQKEKQSIAKWEIEQILRSTGKYGSYFCKWLKSFFCD